MEDAALHTYFDTVILPAGRVALLGAGREGESSYKLLRRLYPQLPITICDSREQVRENPLWQHDDYLDFAIGNGYIEAASAAPLILKSPGVCLKDYPDLLHSPCLTSQADLFLRFFGHQCVGVTGTKGKSTVTHLIYHLLQAEFSCLLAGNMGIPFFDILPQLSSKHKVVCEFSSHQLEQVHTPPRVGVLLNLYEEHLDHYVSFEAYQRAKMHIVGGECTVINGNDKLIAERLMQWAEQQTEPAAQQPELAARPAEPAAHPLQALAVFGVKDETAFSVPHNFTLTDSLWWQSEALTSSDGHTVFDFTTPHPLIGLHNERNLAAALLAAKQMGGTYPKMLPRVASFQPLPHRLQYVGCYGGAHYFNDSISTIPQACIAAVKSVERLPYVKQVSCLILGGFDRQIDYTPLVAYLSERRTNPIKSIIFVGAAGRRIYADLKARNALPEHALCEDDYSVLVPWAVAHTPPGTACVLSPAAASYDRFKNFEQRGEVYIQLIKKQFAI